MVGGRSESQVASSEVADGGGIGPVVGAPWARTPKKLAPMPTATGRPTRTRLRARTTQSRCERLNVSPITQTVWLSLRGSVW